MVHGHYECKRSTKLAARSHQFVVELARYSRKFCANIYFLEILASETLLRLHALQPTLMFINVNSMSISICCLHDYVSIVFAP